MTSVTVNTTRTSIEITDNNTSTTVLATQVNALTAVTAGPQGPKGDTGDVGPKGDPGAFYVHTQTAPSTTWTMAHNLGFKPSVELLDTGSQEIEGDVVHSSQNVCIAYFTLPIAGFARLN